MLGLLVDTIRSKMERLKLGKSRVAESNHILVLNWSDRIHVLVNQIAIANEVGYSRNSIRAIARLSDRQQIKK